MIAIGCDHGGFLLKEAIVAYLKDKDIAFTDFGTYDEESVDYPIYAKKVSKAVQKGDCEFGILCCGTGIGMSIAANKHKGIRAALVCDSFSAEMTRRHNDANVLCMGGRVLDIKSGVAFAEIFLNTPFEGGRHSKRVAMLEETE